MKIISMLVMVLLLGGCVTKKTRVDDAGKEELEALFHTIYIDGDGNLRNPADQSRVGDFPPFTSLNLKSEAEARRYTRAVQAERTYVDRMIQHFKWQSAKWSETHDKPLELTIFIHGGLNSFSDATERSDRLTARMLEEGQYPVFICWNSGFVSNYWQKLWRIRDGESRRAKGIVTLPFVLLGDVARSVFSAPAALWKEIEDPLLVSPLLNGAREKDAYPRIDRLPARGFRIRSIEPDRGMFDKYTMIWNPVKLVMAPFRDGFGTPAWDAMLRRTDLVLTRSNAYEGYMPNTGRGDGKQGKGANTGDGKAEDLKISRPLGYYADSAATYFLSELAELVPNASNRDMPRRCKDDKSFGQTPFCRALLGEEPASNAKVEGWDLYKTPVNLIGHSMGTIVVNNILAQHPQLRIDNVVFMGAAARLKDVETVVVPWMRDNPSAQFYNLSLDPYMEIAESNYGDLIPRGSLLNWIDFVFGDVKSFKDLTAGTWWNIGRSAEDIFGVDAALNSRVTLTRFGIRNDVDVGPQTHGDFSDFCFWRVSFWNAEEKPEEPLKRLEACAPWPRKGQGVVGQVDSPLSNSWITSSEK